MYRICPYFPDFPVEPANVIYHLPCYHGTSKTTGAPINASEEFELLDGQQTNGGKTEAQMHQKDRTFNSNVPHAIDNELALRLHKLSSRLDKFISTLGETSTQKQKKATKTNTGNLFLTSPRKSFNQTTMNENAQQIAGEEMHGMEQGSSRATESRETYEENVAKLGKLLAEGHKLMLAQSFEEASTVLCDAVELSSKFFGDFAAQSFLPHFNYGKALVEIVRLEALPIKVPLGKIDESDDENEEENAEDKGGLNQNGEDVDSAAKDKVFLTEKKMAASDGDQAAKKNVEQLLSSEVILEVVEEEEDEDDVQIAWENLEVARKICDKQTGDDMDLWKERKADVLVALGDCMTVAENFPSALEEFTEALNIRKQLFGDADRRIAEVHFWIGRTHKLMNDFKTAADHFESAKKVLELLIAVKEREVKEKGEEACVNLCRELEELKDAAKGVDENVQDAVSSIEEQIEREKAMKAILQPFLMKALGANGNTAEANDITGMVKRKAVKRPLGQSEAAEADHFIEDKDLQQDVKMSKTETDNENGEENVVEGMGEMSEGQRCSTMDGAGH
uniref:Tetratricopeptide SHNi-TPR domain-containing protein n=1 Tax=Globodera rostochiensis TaxID=31243 RepID=A0A914H2J6_GLORO